jgi:hypothetical protein
LRQDAWRETDPDAIPGPGGSGAAESHHRSSDRHSSGASPRSRRKRCIHRCRFLRPAMLLANRSRTTRSLALVQAPSCPPLQNPMRLTLHSSTLGLNDIIRMIHAKPASQH